MPLATVHLVRHGEVQNPDGVLYGRLPEFHLSDLGRRMAQQMADHFEQRRNEGANIVYLAASPLTNVSACHAATASSSLSTAVTQPSTSRRASACSKEVRA